MKLKAPKKAKFPMKVTVMWVKVQWLIQVIGIKEDMFYTSLDHEYSINRNYILQSVMNYQETNFHEKSKIAAIHHGSTGVGIQRVKLKLLWL